MWFSVLLGERLKNKAFRNAFIRTTRGGVFLAVNEHLQSERPNGFQKADRTKRNLYVSTKKFLPVCLDLECFSKHSVLNSEMSFRNTKQVLLTRIGLVFFVSESSQPVKNSISHTCTPVGLLSRSVLHYNPNTSRGKRSPIQISSPL